jgi:hypothetical protein
MDLVESFLSRIVVAESCINVTDRGSSDLYGVEERRRGTCSTCRFPYLDVVVAIPSFEQLGL